MAALRPFAILSVFALAVAALSSDRDHGTFQSPGSSKRPMFRYWLPDASVDPEIVASDIQSLGSIGGGGVEFLPYYGYGGEIHGPGAGISWSTYAFGTPAYNDLLERVLEATQEAGLVIDLALYPGSGGAVPARMGEQGLQWDLVPYTTSISASGNYEGLIPGSEANGDLVAVVASVVVSSEIQNISTAAGIEVPAGFRLLNVITVAEDSLVSVTESVTDDRRIDLNLPALQGNQTYELTAFYQNQTLNRGCVAGEDPQNYIQNGSFFVDHFSARGAETTINFWESVILTNKTKALFAEVGKHVWEDSHEFFSTINWTPDLPQVFEEMHGYSIYPYLPLIVYGNNNINLQSEDPGELQFLTTASDRGQSFVNDYRATLLVAYERYLSTLREWAHTMGLKTRQQVSYNLPMDALGAVPYTDVPEGETLQFSGGEIDSFRQFAGPAAVSGRNIFSCELGSTILTAYRQPIVDLVTLFNRAFAGGVNHQVIHGQAFSGYYPNTTWPGFNTFLYTVAENWSPRQPLWDNGLAESLEYAARAQTILQSGVPKTDIVFYLKESTTDVNLTLQYNATDLVAAGYTYHYLSPLNFQLPEAVVENATLAAKGPAYKALVIESSQNLTLDAVTTIQNYAEAGLPIILVDGAPGIYPEARNVERSNIVAQINALQQRPNVFTSSRGSVAPTLAEIGIIPRISIIGNSNSTSTVWRQDDAEGIDYAFVYSDAVGFSGELQVASTGVPYTFDTWTGTREPLLHYTVNSNGLRIPISLAAGQTKIFAFARDAIADLPSPEYHLVQIAPNVVGSEYDCGSGAITVHVANTPIEANQSIVSSNGKTCDVTPPKDIQPPFNLPNWELTVEQWNPPFDLYDLSVIAIKSNVTQELTAPLASWLELPGLNETAGIGFYSANFTWTPTSSNGAYLEIDRVLDTPRVYINGVQTPSLDIFSPRVNISPYLRDGVNEVMIKVASTYWNRLLPMITELETLRPNGFTLLPPNFVPLPQDQGIIGDVTITPFEARTISM